jgi:hypothetical protein
MPDLEGKVALITTDVFPQMVPHLLHRTIRASIYQNPYGTNRRADSYGSPLDRSADSDQQFVESGAGAEK